jgi:hypothetical protein
MDKVFAMKKFDQDLAKLGARVMEMGAVTDTLLHVARVGQRGHDRSGRGL